MRTSRGRLGCVVGVLAGLAAAFPAAGQFGPPAAGGSAGLASDRTAQRVGDSLLVIVLENATAANTVRNDTDRRLGVRAEIEEDNAGGDSIGLNLRGDFRGTGQTARTGRMVAQISATVTGVHPNGDLQVVGEQRLNINGENTIIRVQGRVRPVDISADNSVLSSRLADAAIDYDGAGFVSRSSARGPVGRVFSWLGLL